MSLPSTEELPPLNPISKNNHGGYVVFTVFAALSVTLICWASRLLVRWQKKVWALDDLFLVVAFVLAIAQSACVQSAVGAGLGKRQGAYDIDTERLFKSYYAAQILSIASQTCSKASINLLFGSFASFRPFVIANTTILALTSCWGFASVIAFAFECRVPQTWLLEFGRCMNLESIHIGVDTVSIITEAGLILLPAAFMPKVQTRWSIRLLVIGCFATRALVIVALVGQMMTAHDLINFDDISFSYTTPAIWMQLTMNLSILTACVPGMQHVLADLRPGMTTLVVGDGHVNEYSKSGSVFGSVVRGDPMRSTSNAWEMSKTGSVVRSKVSRNDKDEDTESVQELTTRDGIMAQEISIEE